jgi:hypothetical protein
MSLGIAFKGPEGIVLAADSRVTLTAQLQNPQIPNQRIIIPSTFDSATKLLRVTGQDYVGVVTYGLGAIGTQEPRTAHSFLPELEAVLSVSPRLSVQDFATQLSSFFMQQWVSFSMPLPPSYTGEPMVFLVGGYDENASYGKIFEIAIPQNPTPIEHNPGIFGVVWGGQRQFTDRLIQGFDPQLPSIVQSFLHLTDADRDALEVDLKTKLNVAIPYQFLPLQDCVDLSIFLIRISITLQNWIVGVRGVGGAIDVATITRTDGFTPIQQKKIIGERTII